MSIRATKTPDTVSRSWICTRSGKNSTKCIRLLFCTEIIILSNKLSKRYRVNRMTDVVLREEVVDGS